LRKNGPASAPDPSRNPTESRSAESEVRRVLNAPLVAEAIRVLEPEAIRVRLPDGRVWTALPGTRQPNDSRDSHANGVPPVGPTER
jgi:plasmid stability protein